MHDFNLSAFDLVCDIAMSEIRAVSHHSFSLDDSSGRKHLPRSLSGLFHGGLRLLIEDACGKESTWVAKFPDRLLNDLISWHGAS